MSKNQMVSLRSLFSALFIIIAITLIFSACESGLDPTAIPLDGRVIDYTAQMRKPGPGHQVALAFSEISPLAGVELNEPGMEALLGPILINLDDMIKNWPEAPLLEWAAGIKEDIQKYALPEAITAGKDAEAARKLALFAGQYLKEDGDKSLSLLRTKVLGFVPSGALEAFKLKYTDLIDSFRTLYRSAVRTANRILQQRALEYLWKMEDAIAKLAENVDKTTMVIDNRVSAKNNMVELESLLGAIRPFVNGMGSPGKVGDGLASSIKDFMDQKRAKLSSYIGLLGKDSETTVQGSIDSLDKASADLEKVSSQYLEIEKDFKGVVDLNLKLLVLQAFLGNITAVASENAMLHRETDVNNLAQFVSRHNVSLLSSDDSALNLIYALAAAVNNGSAATFGLSPTIKSILGPDRDKITRDKHNLNMNDGKFDSYLKSIGQKIRKLGTNGAHIYIVFADKYPKGADIAGMVAELAKNGGKVIVIAKDTSKFNGQLFSAQGLNADEGEEIAKIMLKEDGIDAVGLGGKVARLFRAFGDMNLGNIGPVVKDVAAMLKVSQNYSDESVRQAILKALARRSIYVTSGKGAQDALDDTSPQVENNLKNDPFFYKAGPRVGATSVGLPAELDRLLLRQDEAGVKARGLQEGESLKNTLARLKEFTDKKQAKERDAVKIISAGFNRGKADLIERFKLIKATAARCSAPNLERENPANVGAFPPLVREQLLKIDVKDPIAEAIFEGNATASKVGEAACLVFGKDNGRVDAINGVLDKAQQKLENEINTLKRSIERCLASPLGPFSAPNGRQDCLLKAQRDFEKVRTEMVLGSSALSRDVTSKIEPFPVYDPNPSTTGIWRAALGDPSVWFWSNPADMIQKVFKLTPNRSSIGALLNVKALDAAANKPKREGLVEMNQHYYIKALLEVLGVDKTGKITVNKAVNYDLKDPPSDRTELLSYIFKNFDNNKSILVKIRRELNDQYNFLVANFLAQSIYRDLRTVVEKVMTPFWEQPGPVLLSFNNDAAKKAVWDAMVRVRASMDKLALALQGDFIKQGNGMESQDDADLNNFIEKLSSVLEEIGKLKVALLDTKMDARPLENIVQLVGDRYVFKNKAIEEALENARLLLKYNYVDFNDKLPGDKDPERDPMTGEIIKHPLDK